MKLKTNKKLNEEKNFKKNILGLMGKPTTLVNRVTWVNPTNP
jgi:preprotein translocase subunit SecE